MNPKTAQPAENSLTIAAMARWRVGSAFSRTVARRVRHQADRHARVKAGRCRRSARSLLLLPLLCVIACRSEPPAPSTKEVIVWRPLGSWTGRGDKQTETFTSDTGGFRVHWETTHEAPPDTGRLRVVFRSLDSGREIIEAIDARGVGSGLEEVGAERPRWYYLTIESANVDWTVSIDERIEASKR